MPLLLRVRTSEPRVNDRVQLPGTAAATTFINLVVPHAVMAGCLQELRRIGGWGSSSPLTRDFTGSKLLQRRRPYLPLRVLQGLAN